MGSPIANMLLGQAAPAAAPVKDVSQMTPEELSAYVASLQAANPTPAPTPEPTPTPAPAPAAPAPGEQGFLARLLSRFLPSTSSLAPQGQPTPRPLTPEELAERNRILAGGR